MRRAWVFCDHHKVSRFFKFLCKIFCKIPHCPGVSTFYSSDLDTFHFWPLQKDKNHTLKYQGWDEGECNETADSDLKRTLQAVLKYRKNAEISKEILRGEDTISLGRQFC